MGASGIAAYVAELAARDVPPEAVLVAIRSWPAGSDFPPSVPNLAAAARRDLSGPTFDEMLAGVYRRGGVLLAPAPRNAFDRADRERLRDEAQLARAGGMHPLISGFVGHVGLAWLRTRDPAGEYGFAHRRELEQAWSRFTGREQERDALPSARRGGPGKIDAIRAIGDGHGSN